MAKATFDSPIFSLTPAERLDREAKTIQNMPIDPDIQEMKDAPMGSFMLGARNSFTGALGFQVGGMVDAFMNDSGSEPLNLSKGRSEYNPTADPLSWGMDNNPEGIAQRLENIPFEHYEYVLASGNWDEFDRRVQFIKAGLPDAQQFGSAVGTFVGAASDIAGMLAAGLAAEPLAIAGLGARTTLAGRAVQASSGMWRVQSPAQAAAEAAATISRTNLAARYTALGIGEEVVFQGLRNGLDPVYSPEASDVVYQLAFSGGVGGLVGGAVFGRAFVRSHIEDAASEFRRLRTVDLPGGYSVTYGDRLSFGSPVAADQMLFGPSALSLADESRRVGRDLFFDWQRRADLGVADTNIPGTRTIPIGEVPIAGAPRVVREATSEVGGITQSSWGSIRTDPVFTSAKTVSERINIFRNNGLLSTFPNGEVFAEIDGRVVVLINVGDKKIPFYISTGEAGKAEKGIASGKWYPIFGSAKDGSWLIKGTIEDIARNYNSKTLSQIKDILDNFVGDVRAGFWEDGIVGGKYIGNAEETFRLTGFRRPVAARTGMAAETEAFLKDLGVTDESIGGTLKAGDLTGPGDPRNPQFIKQYLLELDSAAASSGTRIIGTAQETIQRPLKPTIGVTAKPTIGVRSAIKAAAFELQLAGVELNEAVFAMLAQAIVRTNAKRVTAGAFNKEFWAEVSSNLPPEAVAKLRPVSERAFIPGIDRTVMDAVTRDDMVTEVWNHFRAGTHMDPANEKSLIFQVLQEIRNRGGMVNRKVVEDVVDRLREISQNPPKRVNAKGKTVLDANQRRLQVINLINEKTGQLKRGAAGAKPIAIPNSLISRMGGTGVRNIPMGGFGEPTAPTVGGTRDFSDVPRVSALLTERIPLWSAIGNQSARAMESANGAARWIAHHVFHARRAFDKAQPTTIFESGTTLLHKSMYMFNRAYRNGLVRFAMGNGTDNVLDQPTIINSLKAFGRREMARDFHRRVAKQLRTGAYDDSVDAVNDAARGMRELFNNIHELASEVGVKGFTRSAVVNYMPRLWRFDKIRRLATTAEGRADLTNLIKASINQNGRKIVIDGVEQTIEGDLDSAAKAFAERLISIAQKTENAPLLDQEQELADALGDLLAPLKAKTPSRTPFGRARILLDENASVAATGDHFSDGMRALSIADLTNDDLPFVFRKYVTSVMGAINERRLLNAFNEELRARNIMGASRTNAAGETVQEIAEVSTIDDMMKVARKLGGEIEAGQEEGLREVIAAMRYEPIHRGSAGLGDRILGIALPYGYLTTGGQFGLAAVGEIARIVGTLGIKRVIQQMPVIAEMLSNWKNLDRPAQNMASFVDSWFAPSTDRLRRALFNPLSDGVRYGEVSTGGIVYSAVKRGLDGASNFMSDITGLAPITSMTQQLTAATTMQHLYDVAKGGAKRLDVTTVRSLGLEMDQYEQLIRYVGNNAEIKNGFMGPRVVGMGNLDAREMDLLRNFVGRMVRTRIQDVPTRGDFHKMAFSFVGRLLTQFRTFNLKGIDNFLIQNAGRINRGGGAKVAQEVMATMLFAGLIQYGRNYADWASFKASGDKKRAERMENLLGASGFIRGAMSGPAEFFLLGVGGDAIWTSTISPDPIFSPYRYTGLDWFGFPGEAMARRGYEVYKDVYGATVGKALGLPAERDITRSTIHKARLLLFGQNAPFLKQYLNIKEEDIATEWNLQQTQSRD